MKKTIAIFTLLTLIFLSSTSKAEKFDSIQPTENIYQSIVKPSHRLVTLNLISNFGKVEVPTSTIITHANNDFRILRFEQDSKNIWHLAKKDTVLTYTDDGSRISLGIQKNLAIKKTPDRIRMIVVINVPSFWPLADTNVRLILNPWTLDRVGRLQEYTPGSLLDWEKNFRALYDDIRKNEFAEPWMILRPEIQRSFNAIYVGDIYISKGLIPKLTSSSYTANKYQVNLVNKRK